jgi:microcystin-dependent protein
MLFPFGFAPKGWVPCNGQLMAINQNQALFALLGTTFGGDGRATFGLPNLQGLTPIMSGAGYTLGSTGGQATHTLTINEVPTHTHSLQATANGASTPAATGNLPAKTTFNAYTPSAGSPPATQPMNNGTLLPYGGSQAHENRTPFVVMNWCIAVSGIFPSQN